jgi:hypothetical protein
MKRKKINKKLALNKKTVANLGDDILNGARGGATNDTCDSCNGYTYCLGCPTLLCPDSMSPGCTEIGCSDGCWTVVNCPPLSLTLFYCCG